VGEGAAGEGGPGRNLPELAYDRRMVGSLPGSAQAADREPAATAPAAAREPVEP